MRPNKLSINSPSFRHLLKDYLDSEISLPEQAKTDLESLFGFDCANPDCFPNINLNDESDYAYVMSWAGRYAEFSQNLPSLRKGKMPDTPYDEAINVIVQQTLGLSDAELQRIQLYHTLAMMAENIQGNLLEQYLDSKLSSLGWIWCMGNVVASVDFAYPPKGVMLQVKNKYNTENSSSNKVREGTTILKWFRLGKKVVNGKAVADFRWNELNRICIDLGQENPHFSEEDYLSFLREIISQNPNLLIERQ